MSLRSAFLALAMLPFLGTQVLALPECDWSGFFDPILSQFYSRMLPRPVDYRPARVIDSPEGEVHLYDGEGGRCPGSICRRDDVLDPGDEVIVSSVYDGWACVFRPDPKAADGVSRERVGWVAARSLKIGTPIHNPRLEDWLGKWEYQARKDYQWANVELRPGKAPGTLFVEGVALGYGGNVPHTGSLEDLVKVKRNLASFNERGICRGMMFLLGDWLVAMDNMGCGGLNVTFGGVYHRIEP